MRSENVAHRFGGAISMLGSATSTLAVDDSIFELNSVAVPLDGADLEITVRLNTVR